MIENEKRWWLRGGLLGQLFPLSLIIYGLNTEGAALLALTPMAFIASPFSFAYGAVLGYFAQGVSSPDTSFRFYRNWTIISGIVAFLPPLFLILVVAWSQKSDLFDILSIYYSHPISVPFNIFIAVFTISFYKMRTYGNISHKAERYDG